MTGCGHGAVVAVVLQCLVFLVLDFALAQDGSWQTLKENTGISSMHTAITRFDTAILLDRTNIGPSKILLPNGLCRQQPLERIAKVDCSAHSVMFDPVTRIVRPLFVFTDTWCSSGQFLADGTLVQTGGDFEGVKKIRRLSPCRAFGLCDWVESTSEELTVGRWYASNQLLPDGVTMIVVGGRNAPSYEFVPKRAPGEGAFKLTLLDGGYDNLYPYVHLLPGGNLFIFAARDSVLLNYKTGEILRKYPTIPGNTRNYPAAGSSTLLPLSHETGFQVAEVVVCGGSTQGGRAGPPASKSCGKIVATSATPNWAMEDMPVARTMGDMIILPTGDVLIINGAQNGAQGWGTASNPVLQPCLYATNDSANRFKLLAATSIPRMYHSTANLLSDGRILLAGSNTHQFYTFNNTQFPTELRVEAFSPPYLSFNLNDQRPVLVGWPTSIKYSRQFYVTYFVSGRTESNNAPIPVVEANLNSSPFVTHSYAQGQRQLKLKTQLLANNWRRSSFRTVVVVAPPNSNVAPPQYYMLFVLQNGVPGKAKWVQIG